MKENVVVITDKNDRSFLMHVWTPSLATKLKVSLGFGGGFSNFKRGSWEAFDKGFLRFESGIALRVKRTDSLTANDLLLRLPDGDEFYREDRPAKCSWGMRLWNYDGWNGINPLGVGWITESWALGLTPGRITWQLASVRDLAEVGMQESMYAMMT